MVLDDPQRDGACSELAASYQFGSLKYGPLYMAIKDIYIYIWVSVGLVITSTISGVML